MKTGAMKGGLSFRVNRVEGPIEDLPVPSKVTIPLKQHLGGACKAKLKKGQEVKIGDIIGEGVDEFGAPIHATVSGKVVGVTKRFPDIRGGYVGAIVVESDEKEEWNAVPSEQNPEEQAADQLLQAIQTAGVVDFGIDAVPVATKLTSAQSRLVKVLIVNGVDLEPGVAVRHKLLVERKQELVAGIKIVKKILNVNTAYLAIEDVNSQARTELLGLLSGVAELAVLKSKFPQGLDKFVVKAITGKEVPSPNGAPEDVGVCVLGADTVIAIWDAVKAGRPVIDQVITVYGAVNSPKNLRVRIGTPLKEVLNHCGVTGEIGKVIVGGPMMGLAQYTLNIPVTKEMTAIYVQRESDVAVISDQKCINCGWCVKVCPMGLLPNMIASYCEVDMFEEAESYNLSYCIECGCCAYVCPAKIPLVHWIKYGKSQLKREEQ
ncbi:MAG: electron transport complex subunit RsxC [Candidatus Desulfofervidaceae bacterium]|nr:electron transport complex subunit RsxC [Candidatus Desulfofervidaceae bacterium]